MKKFSKIGKRVLAFFLVALMNINTYATTTANDGSSFVTKAEFDDMMTGFNIKMSEYQSALNAKIDNAISGYISKMSGSSTVEQENLAEKYATLLGIEYIYPVRELSLDKTVAHRYNYVNMFKYDYWSLYSKTAYAETTVRMRICQYYLFKNETTNVLPETADNRFKRIYLVGRNGKFAGAIRNINVTGTSYSYVDNLSNQYYGLGTNGDHSIKLKTSLPTVNKNTTTGLYDWSGFTIKTGVRIDSIKDNVDTINFTVANRKLGYQSDIGGYGYSYKTENELVSQICTFTHNSGKIIDYNDMDNQVLDCTASTSNKLKYVLCDYNASPTFNTRPVVDLTPHGTTLTSNDVYSYLAEECGATGYIYSGVPVFKSSLTGKATVTIELKNANLGNICIVDATNGFSNGVGITEGVPLTVDGTYKGTSWDTNNGDTGVHTMQFDCVLDKVYWIKYIPNANGPSYKISKIVVKA